MYDPPSILIRQCLAIVLALLPGFASNGRPLPDGGQLIVGEDQPPPHFNPLHADDMYVVRATELIFDGLIGFDTANVADRPGLARAWRYDDALPGFVFDLRTDVRWHDDAPFTSADVVFTVDLMRRSHGWFADLVARAEARGPGEVALVLVRRPDEPDRTLSDLTFKILPRHAFPRGTRRVLPTDRFNQRPIGTGPYRIDAREGGSVGLVRAEGPRPRRGHLERIRLHGAADKDLQKDSLRTGLLGMVVRVRPKDVKELEAARRELEVFEYASMNWWYLAYNHRQPHVRERAVRQAITRVVDREALRVAHLGRGWTISGPFAHRDLRNPRAVEPRRRDVGKARDLLTRAGYRRDGKGNLIDPDGAMVRLRLLVQPPLGQAEGLFTDLRAQFAEVGIELIVDKAPDIPAWRERMRRGDDYDMVLGRWRSTPGDFIRPLFHSKGAQNWIGYRNRALDAQLDQLRTAKDAVQRQAIMETLHRMLAEDLPYTFLWSLEDFSAFRRRSYQNLSLIHPYYYFTHVGHWARRK